MKSIGGFVLILIYQAFVDAGDSNVKKRKEGRGMWNFLELPPRI